MKQQEMKKIIAALEEKWKTKSCPWCGNEDFDLMDGYFCFFVQERIREVELGGSAIPTIAVVCKNCGWMSHHALKPLGLI